MRLVTYSRMGVPSIGVELDSGVLDIPDAASHFGRKYHVRGHSFPSTMLELLQWPAGISVVRQIIERYENTPEEERLMTHPMDSVTLEAPVSRPGKIVALGKNYLDHVEETDLPVPVPVAVVDPIPSKPVSTTV